MKAVPAMGLRGAIRVPSDKSLSHRAVLFSALAEGESSLHNVLPSDDVLSSLAAVEALGACVERAEGECGLELRVTGFAAKPACESPVTLDCGNSGTTTRLLMGLMCGLGVDVTLVGDASLSARPMGRVVEPLRLLGANIECESGTLPVRVLPAAGGLKAAHYNSPKASAQVKSAVLLAGLQASGTTSVTEPAKSRNHTELLLPAYGVPVAIDGLTASVCGPAKLHAHDMTIPGDPSSAAFIAVAASVMAGSDVLIRDVALNKTRAGAFEVLRRMGAALSFENEHTEGAEPVGDVHVAYTSKLKGTIVTAEEIPTLVDEVPILAVAAAAAEGETVFKDAGELRVKESDRFVAVINGLASFGVRAWGEGDDLHILGTGAPLPHLAETLERTAIDLPTFHDHRLAMTWYLMGIASKVDVALDDAACVSVSWPSFYEDVAALHV